MPPDKPDIPTVSTDTGRPLVSVLMIAYNKERYIDEAIRGVIKQLPQLQRLGFGLELIIMDDHSTDATPQIIERHRREHPDIIRAFRNPHNLGLQGNYLAGFPRCRGRYMAICDADDYWFSGKKLSRQVRYMESHPECAVTFHRMVNLYEERREMSLSNGSTPQLTDLANLSRSNYITNSSVVYRRALIDLTALPEWMRHVVSPDYAMHIFYATKGSIRFFSRPMGVYRKAAGSAWSLNDDLRRLRMSLEVRKHLIEWLGDDYPEATRGLQDSVSAINRAIAQIQNAPEHTSSASTAPSPRPGLMSRLRAALSRFIPRPRP